MQELLRLNIRLLKQHLNLIKKNYRKDLPNWLAVLLLSCLLYTSLQAEHYSVDSCYDGGAVFDYLAGAEYDGLILDIMMPVMDCLLYTSC